MPFLTDTVTVRSCGPDEWELLDPLVYEGEVDRWVVEPGFRTDFASIPAIAAWLIPRTGTYTRAAILHDWFCRVGIQAGIIDPVDADGVFRRVLREAEVPFLLRWIMWAGVRASALTQEHRRPGWWRTAPQFFAAALAALPLITPAALVIVPSLWLYRQLDRVFT